MVLQKKWRFFTFNKFFLRIFKILEWNHLWILFLPRKILAPVSRASLVKMKKTLKKKRKQRDNRLVLSFPSFYFYFPHLTRIAWLVSRCAIHFFFTRIACENEKDLKKKENNASNASFFLLIYFSYIYMHRLGPRLTDKTNPQAKGWVSTDRSVVTALPSTTPRQVPKSSTYDSESRHRIEKTHDRPLCAEPAYSMIP